MAFLWRRYFLIPVFAALVGGFIGYGVARVTEGRRWPDVAFGSDKWKAVSKYDRYIYWNDIERRRLLTGKTRDDVVQLLGPPDSEDKGSRLVYLIRGNAGEFMVSVYVAEINFDNAGRVATTKIVTD
jgi:hypothetical protein